MTQAQERLNAAFPIVFDDGTMQQAFRDFMTLLAINIPQTGTGSPEGVIEGAQFTFYIDETGTAGNILWVKRDTDIAGDPTQGWVLV